MLVLFFYSCITKRHLCNYGNKKALTTSGRICRIFGWCPPRVPIPWLLPLWHFTDTVIIILLSWWTNMFWPFTAWRHIWSWCTSLVIFTTPTNTTVHATSPTFFLRFTPFMVVLLSFTIFATLFLRRSDTIWNRLNTQFKNLDIQVAELTPNPCTNTSSSK